MSATLSPYRDWLGIETPTATPNYYELLGVPPLETDSAKIGAAFQRQTQRLTPHLSGSEADVAQRLMGELAEARMTLLTPTAKRAYDQALASRYQAAPNSSAAGELSIVSDPNSILPPAATPEAAAPSAVQGYPQTNQPYQQPAQGYAGYGPAQAYPAAVYPAQSYPAAQAHPYPSAQGYPSPGYPAWQPQAAAPGVAPAAYPASPYYAAPQAATGYAAEAPAAQPEAVPMVRRRPMRRRSSAVPALAGVAAVVAITLGGLWLYSKGTKSLAVVEPEKHPGARETQTTSREPTREHQSIEREGVVTRRVSEGPATKPPASPKIEPSVPQPPFDPVMPGRSVGTPEMEKPSRPPLPEATKPEPSNPAMTKPEAAKPEPAKPEPAKPEIGKPAVPSSDTPTEPAETKATAEERKAVDDALDSARTALAGRDVAKARDLLAEATIEATADDTLADVNHVEQLTDYVEMFWDAVRKTLPKVELAELEIDGKVMNVVEADENHIVVRAEGKNYEYRWQKLPNKLAYYLANRWLAEDDPVRNLVLASFEIVEPKGDRAHARSLLGAASAAGLNAEPLMAELAKAAQSKKN